MYSPDEVPGKGASVFGVLMRTRQPDGSYVILDRTSLSVISSDVIEILLVHNYEKPILDKGRPVLDKRTHQPIVKPEGFGLPGGVIEQGETFRQAATSESLEEAGLFLEFGDVLVEDQTSPDGHRNFAIAARASFEQPTLSQLQLIAGLDRYAENDGKRFIEKWLHAARHLKESIAGCNLRPDDPDWGVMEARWMPLQLVLSVGKVVMASVKDSKVTELPIYKAHIRRIRLMIAACAPLTVAADESQSS